MRKLSIVLMTLFGVLLCMPITAQVNHSNSKEKQAYQDNEYIFGKRNVDTLVIKVMTENMPQHFNAPNMPRFTLIGKENKFFMSIGGYAKMTVSYDWDNPINSPYSFAPSDIPMSTEKGDQGLLQYGIGTSNISFNFVAFPESKYRLGTFIDVIFDHANYAARLHYAYVKWVGFIVGYNTSLFTDAAAGPPTIDFQGPNSMPFYRNCVVDYVYSWGKHWEVAAGLEMPIANYTSGSYTSAINQKVPDIPLYIKFAWDKRSSWVRVGGLLRNLQYRDDVTNKIKDDFGWGVQLSGSIGFIPQLTLYYDGLYGKGISNYINDLNGLGLDMLPRHNHNGELSTVESLGGYLGLQYNFIPSAFISGTYSVVHTSCHDGMYENSQYKNGQYVAANVFWNVNAQITLGLEYLWGEYENAVGKYTHDNRLHCMLQFNL